MKTHIQDNLDISCAKTLEKLYYQLIYAREFDTMSIILQRSGKIRMFPSSQGAEALFIALSYIFDATDTYCPYYRQPVLFVCRN